MIKGQNAYLADSTRYKSHITSYLIHILTTYWVQHKNFMSGKVQEDKSKLKKNIFSKFAPPIGQIGPKKGKNGQNYYISKTKRARMLIFVPIPPFFTPLSPFIIVSNIPNYWLPPNWALGVPKWVKNHPNWVKLPYFRY